MGSGVQLIDDAQYVFGGRSRFQRLEHTRQRRGERDDLFLVFHRKTPVPTKTLVPERRERTPV